MVFRSKIDQWLVAVAISALCLTAWAVTMAGVRTGAWWPLFAASGIWLVVGAFTIPMLYVITPAELLVRGGLFWRVRVPLKQITSVLPSSSAFASPAWSLDGLEVCWDGRRLLISPRDQQRFLDELRSRTPGLEPSSGGLARLSTNVSLTRSR
jgi:hypothetical protein